MSIRILPQNLINQIAAGEVIERPSSVIKELVENAIDAGASEIAIKIIEGGKSFISVQDNGSGMDQESLKMCILTHATSKLQEDNLFDIHTFGFRGEALPSIASISRLTIETAFKDEAWQMQMESSKVLFIKPINKKQGTLIIVNDLFFATPARLKFLKSTATEADSCINVVNKIALAFKNITLKFFNSDKLKLNYEKTDDIKKRISDVLGNDAIENMSEIEFKKDNMKLFGYISTPTYNKSSLGCQYFFVNNRPVKDSVFAAALRSAYQGLIPPGRFVPSVLFLELPYDEVDVNAHPAKVEVRFKNAEKVRYLLFSSIKQALRNVAKNSVHVEFGDLVNKKVAVVGGESEILEAFESQSEMLNSDFENISHKNSSCINYNFAEIKTPISKEAENSLTEAKEVFALKQSFNRPFKDDLNKLALFLGKQKDEAHFIQNISDFKEPLDIQDFCQNESLEGEISLGKAVAQISNTYIIAQNFNDLIIIDQHAAAERITLEKLKKNIKLDSQVLLMPEVCNLSESKVEILEKNLEFLNKFGIHFDKMSSDLISVNSLPAIFEDCNAKALINDISDDFVSFNNTTTLDDKVHKIFSTKSCHNSLRAGKKLSFDAMNSLLRQMEKTPNIAQCCHGRPSYVVISIADLNKFFERS